MAELLTRKQVAEGRELFDERLGGQLEAWFENHVEAVFATFDHYFLAHAEKCEPFWDGSDDFMAHKTRKEVYEHIEELTERAERVKEVEAERDSLKLALDASDHVRTRDVEYALSQRNKWRDCAEKAEAENLSLRQDVVRYEAVLGKAEAERDEYLRELTKRALQTDEYHILRKRITELEKRAEQAEAREGWLTTDLGHWHTRAVAEEVRAEKAEAVCEFVSRLFPEQGPFLTANSVSIAMNLVAEWEASRE